MPIKVYNDLTQRKEELIPLKARKLGMYLCGPTVYGPAHVGNLRTFVSFDMIRRYLRYRGYNVTFVQNITDIEDKMIKGAAERGVTVEELAEQFVRLFFEDTKDLGIEPADFYPRATEHIPEIIDLIKTLEARGLAYHIDGDVYFEVPKFEAYGQLVHQNLEELQAGARVDVDERKRHPIDFALWKKQKPGEPAWDSPWGRGRPGWHVECSAMAMKYLGETVDIHGGGIDLVFPHHENEIAQSTGATGQPFARYWMHGAFLNFEGEKMSKSLGNIFTLGELKKKFRPEVLRFFFLSSHYRSPLNYSEDLLRSAEAGLERIYNTIRNVKHLEEVSDSVEPAPAEAAFLEGLEGHRRRFLEAMDDDFNSAEAIGVLFEIARDVNAQIAGGASRALTRRVLEIYRELGGQVLGLFWRAWDEDALDAEIADLVEKRQAARKAKNWAEADRIRDELNSRGIVLEDTPQGVRWKRK